MSAAYEAFQATVGQVLRRIWDEGYKAGWEDAAKGDGDTPNPYRIEAKK